MTVEEVIENLETTLLDDIAAMSPKERAAFWSNIKEFVQAKRQRATYRQSDDVDTEFKVTIFNSKKEVEDGA